jgi:bacterioferritin-associated ferredoxin
MSAATTCSTCPAPAVRTLGVDSYCAVCANAILDPIRERVILPTGFDGTGREITPRPDCGIGWSDLKCSVCSATWTGRPNESCGWCRNRYKSMLANQRQLTLRPNLPSRNDPKRIGALDAWAQRLARAVRSEIVTEADARDALDREAGDRHGIAA